MFTYVYYYVYPLFFRLLFDRFARHISQETVYETNRFVMKRPDSWENVVSMSPVDFFVLRWTHWKPSFLHHLQIVILLWEAWFVCLTSWNETVLHKFSHFSIKKQTNNWYKQDQASPCSFAKKMYCCYWIRMFSMRYDKHRNVCRDCLSPRLSVVSSSWSPGYSESFQRVKQRQLLRQLRQLHQLGTARSSCRCLDSPRRQRKCAPGGGVKVSRISGFLGDSRYLRGIP